MKISFLPIKYVVFFILLSYSISAQNKISLNEGWEFRKSGTNDEWLNAKVPGSIYNDLFLHELIPHPFDSCNHQELEWIENTSWEYRLTFTKDKIVGNRKYDLAELIFMGLDTHAELFLNNNHLLRANNMHRKWHTDVTQLLTEEENSLRIIFHPAKDYIQKQKNNLEFTLPGGEWAYIRKAAFQFGWDWTPRLVGCGIWQPVYLQLSTGILLKQGYISTQTIDSKQAKMHADFTIESQEVKNVTLKVINNSTGNQKVSRKVQLKEGQNNLGCDFMINQPELWYPNNLGEQNLYYFSMVLETPDGHQQQINQKVGIRSIELINEEDEYGTSFYFKVNGDDVFIKGANIIPPHSFIPNLDSAWIQLAIDAHCSHMNMLRVWGGGIYPPDAFYEACDSLGIMVWQDFMFACSMYPWNQDFIKNIRLEATEQVQRLRRFTSLVLWCGNNETDEGWHNWGWQHQVKNFPGGIEKIWGGYQKVFHDELKKVVKTHDPQRPYWSSSPQYGWGREKSMSHGDAHYWGVWWGKEPFEIFEQKVPRFMSEYGFQSFPSMHTIKSFASTKNLPDSSELYCHQKHPEGFKIIDLYMQREGFAPENIQEKIYLSQITQAIGYQKAIHAHRLATPKCMGTLYWQFNDSWPAISWSGIDFYGRWKAVQYQVKRSYKPILVVPSIHKEKIEVNLMTDLPHKVNGILKVMLLTPQGEKIEEWEKDTFLNARYPVKIFDMFFTNYNPDTKGLIVYAQFETNQKIKYSGLAVNQKWGKIALQHPNIHWDIKKLNDEKYIEFSTQHPAFFVQIDNTKGDLKLSDNFFHLMPGETHKVKLIKGDLKNINIQSLVNYQ